MKLKRIFTNFRVMILLFFLVAAIVVINPNPGIEDVTIRNIIAESAASEAGMQNLKSTTSPRSRERILLMNNKPIKSIEEYYAFTSTLRPNQSVQIKTNKGFYKLTTKPILNITVLNETEEKVIQEVQQVNQTINGTIQLVNKTVNKTITVNKIKSEVIGTENLGFDVYDSPTTNIRQGLDLQGGTRVLLQPDEKVSPEDMDIIITNMNQRLNVFGLSDVVIRTAKDLTGQQYISVEIAGVSKSEIKDLLSKQGKFEAKIGNKTVFIGGKRDITYVCRTADCSGIDPSYGCSQESSSGWGCRFNFAISLSPKAAQNQADITALLSVVQENGQSYLNEVVIDINPYIRIENVKALFSIDMGGSTTREKIEIEK